MAVTGTSPSSSTQDESPAATQLLVRAVVALISTICIDCNIEGLGSLRRYLDVRKVKDVPWRHTLVFCSIRSSSHRHDQPEILQLPFAGHLDVLSYSSVVQSADKHIDPSIVS